MKYVNIPPKVLPGLSAKYNGEVPCYLCSVSAQLKIKSKIHCSMSPYP